MRGYFFAGYGTCDSHWCVLVKGFCLPALVEIACFKSQCVACLKAQLRCQVRPAISISVLPFRHFDFRYPLRLSNASSQSLQQPVWIEPQYTTLLFDTLKTMQTAVIRHLVAPLH